MLFDCERTFISVQMFETGFDAAAAGGDTGGTGGGDSVSFVQV